MSVLHLETIYYLTHYGEDHLGLQMNYFLAFPKTDYVSVRISKCLQYSDKSVNV
jgi:hypothetical protein